MYVHSVVEVLGRHSLRRRRADSLTRWPGTVSIIIDGGEEGQREKRGIYAMIWHKTSIARLEGARETRELHVTSVST